MKSLRGKPREIKPREGLRTISATYQPFIGSLPWLVADKSSAGDAPAAALEELEEGKILRGVVNSGVLDAKRIVAYDPNLKREQELALDLDERGNIELRSVRF